MVGATLFTKPHREFQGKMLNTLGGKAVDPIDGALAKVQELQKELEAMGYACKYLIRAPGSARGPVVYLFAGETEHDVEQAWNDGRPEY